MMRMELILSDYNDAYILSKGTITGADTAAVFLKNCDHSVTTPLTNQKENYPNR